MVDNMMKNPEVKGLIQRLFLMLVIVVGVGWFLNISLWNSFNREMVQRNISVIGNIIAQHPELKDEITEAFIRESTKEELKLGIEVAQRYGYTEEMPIGITPIIHRFYRRFLGMSLTGILFSFVSSLGIILFFAGGIFRRIVLLSEGAERIVEGDFAMRLPESDEGAFAKLAHQFNQMSKVLEGNLDRLKEDKIVLKNIISDISHQLKTPLSSLKMFNELMLEGSMDQNTQREFLVKSEQQLERMEWLIKSLLKMARIEAGAIVFRKENRAIQETVEEAMNQLRPRAEMKGQAIILRETKPNIHFFHDANWLAEAIGNMVKNAIDHTGPGGKIEIEISETPVMVRVMIKDNGEGIAEEDLPHVFERFYKGKNNIHGSGTGIGLALAKVIIENHNGMITVKSKVNEGTTFTITFLKGII